MMTKVFMNVLAGYVTILTSQQSMRYVADAMSNSRQGHTPLDLH